MPALKMCMLHLIFCLVDHYLTTYGQNELHTGNMLLHKTISVLFQRIFPYPHFKDMEKSFYSQVCKQALKTCIT